MTTTRSTPIENPAAYEAAIRNRIIFNAQTTFRKNTPDAETLISFLEAQADRGNDFCKSLFNAFNSYGKLTEKQVACVRNSIAKQAERRAEWAQREEEKNATREYIGEVGKRVTLRLKCVRIVEIEYAPRFWGDSGVLYLNFAEDQNGNVVLYRGSSGEFPDKGETLTVKVTIKAHEEYKGVKQTLVQRPKAVAGSSDINEKEAA